MRIDVVVVVHSVSIDATRTHILHRNFVGFPFQVLKPITNISVNDHDCAVLGFDPLVAL